MPEVEKDEYEEAVMREEGENRQETNTTPRTKTTVGHPKTRCRETLRRRMKGRDPSSCHVLCSNQASMLVAVLSAAALSFCYRFGVLGKAAADKTATSMEAWLLQST